MQITTAMARETFGQQVWGPELKSHLWGRGRPSGEKGVSQVGAEQQDGVKRWTTAAAINYNT